MGNVFENFAYCLCIFFGYFLHLYAYNQGVKSQEERIQFRDEQIERLRATIRRK